MMMMTTTTLPLLEKTNSMMTVIPLQLTRIQEVTVVTEVLTVAVAVTLSFWIMMMMMMIMIMIMMMTTKVRDVNPSVITRVIINTLNPLRIKF